MKRMLPVDELARDRRFVRVRMEDRMRDGREMRYRLADPDIIVACGLMRQALQRRLARLAEVARRVADAPVMPAQAAGAPQG